MVSAVVINRSAAWSISSAQGYPGQYPKPKLLYLSASPNVDIVDSSNLKLSKNKNNPCSLRSLAGFRAIIIAASSNDRWE